MDERTRNRRNDLPFSDPGNPGQDFMRPPRKGAQAHRAGCRGCARHIGREFRWSVPWRHEEDRIYLTGLAPKAATKWLGESSAAVSLYRLGETVTMPSFGSLCLRAPSKMSAIPAIGLQIRKALKLHAGLRMRAPRTSFATPRSRVNRASSSLVAPMGGVRPRNSYFWVPSRW